MNVRTLVKKYGIPASLAIVAIVAAVAAFFLFKKKESFITSDGCKWVERLPVNFGNGWACPAGTHDTGVTWPESRHCSVDKSCAMNVAHKAFPSPLKAAPPPPRGGGGPLGSFRRLVSAASRPMKPSAFDFNFIYRHMKKHEKGDDFVLSAADKKDPNHLKKSLWNYKFVKGTKATDLSPAETSLWNHVLKYWLAQRTPQGIQQYNDRANKEKKQNNRNWIDVLA